jgi:hypothetical protein
VQPAKYRRLWDGDFSIVSRETFLKYRGACRTAGAFGRNSIKKAKKFSDWC